MPFKIIRDDLTRVRADAIVNTANPHPVIGAGTDSAVYQAAGAEELLAERKKIGDIPVGKAAVTSAFRLNAKYIIHTVGPAWVDGRHGEEAALAACYESSLELAGKLGCESIAFPLISTGSYGFPEDLALRTASSVIYDFLMQNDMLVILVLFGKPGYELSGKIFSDIQTFIDDNYVREKEAEEYGLPPGTDNTESRASLRMRKKRRRLQGLYVRESAVYESAARQDLSHEDGKAEMQAALRPTAAPDAFRLPDVGKSFQEYLMELIIRKDMKNADVYHGANISKQHFSKIISNRDYRPTKNTACALAVGLHLDPEEANELLEKAGLVLSRSSRFDLAVQYFLEHRMYNIIDDNIILYENGLETLGTKA